MSALKHYFNLEEKHFELTKKIEDAYTHHVPDEEIKKLKLLKLKLKEELFDFQKAMNKWRGS